MSLKPNTINSKGRGHKFAEFACMKSYPRVLQVISAQKHMLWVLIKSTSLRIIKKEIRKIKYYSVEKAPYLELWRTLIAFYTLPHSSGGVLWFHIRVSVRPSIRLSVVRPSIRSNEMMVMWLFFFAESDYMWLFLSKWLSLKKLFVVYAEIHVMWLLHKWRSHINYIGIFVHSYGHPSVIYVTLV